MDVGVLHIPKTGGTALAHALAAHAKQTGETQARLHTHRMTLAAACKENDGRKVAFLVRDPIDRFVSGFNSRLRKGQPRNTLDWTEGEALAFDSFPTPNALAESLYASDSWERSAARFAMQAISHLHKLSFWLGSLALLERCRERIVYAGRTETLSADAAFLSARLGLSATLELPEDEVERHASPVWLSTALSARATENLRRWYLEDYLILDWCERFRNGG